MFCQRFALRTIGAVLAALTVAGCATSTAQMSPAQREGVEMRRYCEQHPEELAKCNGFRGFQ